MQFKQTITICDISKSVFIARCTKNYISAYRNDEVKLVYTSKKPRRAGSAVIYLSSRGRLYDLNRDNEKYVILVSEDPYYGYNDVDRNIFDVIYTEKTSDELIKFRLGRCIDRVHADYLAEVKENLLQKIADSSPNMVWIKDINGRHVMLNDEFCRIAGKDKSHIINKEHPDIWDISWDEYKRTDFACRLSEEEVLKTGKTGVFDEMVMTGGEMKQFTTYKTPVYDAYGNTLGTCGIGHDVTDVNNMGLEMSILMDNVPFPMMMCDAEWKPVRSNNAFLSIAGLDNLRGFDYNGWKTEKIKEISDKEYSDDSISTSQEFEITCNGEKGRFLLLEQAITDFLNNVSGYFCILQDITYRRKYEEEILAAANTDTLTGLYNRRYMVDKIKENRGKPLTLLYMDIDSFKVVNDRFGHKRGDEVLKKTAAAIKEQYPHGICARLGGDEFLVLLVDNDGEELNEGCNDDLIRKVQSFMEMPDAGISLSIGITKGRIVEDVEKFIHDTDQRMYEVKKRHHAISA